MMTPEKLHKRIDADLRAAFRFLVTGIGADEGSLWILDPDGRKLRVALNSGSRYSELELALATNIDGSQVGRCFKEERIIRDTSTFGGPERDLSIDKALHQRTFYQISVPFHMGDKLLGVLSVIQDQSAKKSIEWGFQSDDVDKTLTTAKILARLLS